MKHDVSDSADFRAGMAYAAHMLRHSVGAAHGASIDAARATIATAERRRCCQNALLAFAQGVADGLEDRAGLAFDALHVHGNRS